MAMRKTFLTENWQMVKRMKKEDCYNLGMLAS